MRIQGNNSYWENKKKKKRKYAPTKAQHISWCKTEKDVK
jgi:hypothetical protein